MHACQPNVHVQLARLVSDPLGHTALACEGKDLEASNKFQVSTHLQYAAPAKAKVTASALPQGSLWMHMFRESKVTI